MFRNLDYFGFIVILVLIGAIASIILGLNAEPDSVKYQRLLESCTQTCSGEVQRFEMNWQNRPVCQCK